MSERISLRDAERRAFRATFEDGLWDVLVACFALLFALAPLLSEKLGDFWSSMVFLPFWVLVYLGIRLLRVQVVRPRVGEVVLGAGRRRRLTVFTVLMLVLNAAALALGLLTFALADRLPTWAVPVRFGLIFTLAFALAGYLLDYPRLYVYGLLMGGGPMLGEWLYTRFGISHHGYPVAFGIVVAVALVAGLVVFGRFLRSNPPAARDE